MSNNNYNEKTPWLTIAIVAVVVLGIGYSIVKSSPQNQNRAAAVDPMHDKTNGAGGNDQLSALVGKPMPDIQLADKDGTIYRSADFKGRYTVLFFNEGLMCYPACWNQIAAFGGDERFNSGSVQAISVVVDSARDWQTAIAKMPQLAKATTMFDANATASKQLGMVTTASSMHRGALPGHTYLILDKEGVVRFVFDDPNMAMANDMLWGNIQELN